MKKPRSFRLPEDVSLAEMMWLLDVSEQRLGQLVKDGIVAKAGRGRYLLSSVPKFVAEGRKRGEVTNAYNSARIRYMQAKAARAEAERERESGNWLHRIHVQNCMSSLVINIRTWALALPSRGVPLLLNSDKTGPAMFKVLTLLIEDLLTRIAAQELVGSAEDGSVEYDPASFEAFKQQYPAGRYDEPEA